MLSRPRYMAYTNEHTKQLWIEWAEECMSKIRVLSLTVPRIDKLYILNDSLETKIHNMELRIQFLETRADLGFQPTIATTPTPHHTTTSTIAPGE